MLQESIGLSVILGFLSSEFLGISAGGLVSPGYLAFFLEQPLRLLSTLVVAITIFLLIRLFQRFMIIFGRRRFMAAVLLSLVGTWLFEQAFFYADSLSQDIRIIGYIIPGLIANDMLKQGVIKTLAMVLLVAIIIRIFMMVVHF
jgi:poly-gamma-glutamate biosynthesis protein PgsC/CapC